MLVVDGGGYSRMVNEWSWSDQISKVLQARISLRLQDFIGIAFLLIFLGSIYGFSEGYMTVDYTHYLAEENGISFYTGFDGKSYRISRDVGISYRFSNYSMPSKEEYKAERLKQLW